MSNVLLQMQASYTIQKLEWQDIDVIPELQPKDWSDVASRFREHFGQAYLHPIKVVNNNIIVGIGQLLLFQNSVWLGNIIVRETHWRRGIGRLITVHLMEIAKALNRTNLYLLATPQGQPLYEQLGFQIAGTHAFYQKKEIISKIAIQNPAIRRAEPNHFSQILKLDETASGEDRSALLQRYLEKAWIFQAENQVHIEGFYLAELGEGLLIATTPKAGTALLEFRNKSLVVLPTENTDATQYLENKGYTCFRTAALMYLGNNKKGDSTMIYSRIGGYAG